MYFPNEILKRPAWFSLIFPFNWCWDSTQQNCVIGLPVDFRCRCWFVRILERLGAQVEQDRRTIGVVVDGSSAGSWDVLRRSKFKTRSGDFHSHRGTPSSLDGVYFRENPMKMNDDWGSPYFNAHLCNLNPIIQPFNPCGSLGTIWMAMDNQGVAWIYQSVNMSFSLSPAAQMGDWEQLGRNRFLISIQSFAQDLEMEPVKWRTVCERMRVTTRPYQQFLSSVIMSRLPFVRKESWQTPRNTRDPRGSAQVFQHIRH